jgi:hypothetical protein
MAAARRVLQVHLDDAMRHAAAAGEVGIVNRLIAALPDWRVALVPLDAPPLRDGYSLLHMQEPLSPRSLTLRLAYLYPFWRIEATNERWRFDVAQAAFRPAMIPAPQAARFAARLRERWFPSVTARRGGFVLIPLQGRLAEHRSFQSMSPLRMMAETLRHLPDRPVVATLHPKETYPAEDLAALEALCRQFPRLTVQTGGTDAALANCDLVVAQNSSVALKGFALEKPAVLFAGIDFHHIAGSVPREGVEAAFDRALGPPPDFAAYLTWFFRRQSINATAPDAEAQIRARLAQHGWPVA